ncbi:MAG TPA: primosomal protein N' [Candidatus Eisenbacteria bacterium]|nr:primosomal protein N' [Candidatus Eisenbacteria bacterium]
MFAHVAFPIPVRRTFVYAVPPEWAETCVPGVSVTAPFGAREKRGIVVQMTAETDHDPERVKPLARVLSADPVIDSRGLELAAWVAGYYLCSLGEALAAELPGGLAGLAGSRSRKRAAEEGTLPAPAALPSRFTLTAAQAHALSAVKSAIAEPRFETFLLHGVTGSGKTEVYLQAVLAARAVSKQSLLLVPEVALAHGVVAEARRRFGARVGVLHSYLGVGERRATWERARLGALDLVIGARSAVFAPLPALGLVIVDEEHEPAYKQSEQLRYHGRDVAVMRARLSGAPCLLGSATPSLESYENARRGKYVSLSLPERVDKRPLPTVEIVDLGHGERGPATDRRREEGGTVALATAAPVKVVAGPALLSPRLAALVEAALARHEQVLLFLNRRGHSRVVECDACGFAARCPHCDVSLTFHSTRGLFLCHYCEHTEAARPSCPACAHPFFRYKIAGTQRIERELAQLFPATPVHRLDSDSARTRGHTQSVLEGFASGEPGILLGTQLVAKGHDFPGVTLVGVLNADTSLTVPDFRASERTFQLLTQVAGRAGRGDRPGHVVLQTRHPEHPALVAASRHDDAGFAESELAVREAAGYPPATRLVSFLASSPREDRVTEAIEKIGEWARAQASECPDVEVLGPAPHVLMRLRGRYRWHVTLRARNRRQLLACAVRLWETIEREKSQASVRVAVDVDPQDVL